MNSNVKVIGKITLPAKATVFYTLTGALERGMTLIFTPIFTRILSPEEFGLYPRYVSWMGILTVILTLELSGSVIYKGLVKYKHREGEFLSSAFGIITLLTLSAIFVAVLFGDLLYLLTGLSKSVMVFLILQIYLNGVANLFFAKCRFFYKYKLASMLNVVSAILSPTLSLLVIRFSIYKSEGRIIGPLAISALIVIPIICSILKGSSAIFNKEIWKYIFTFTLPLILHFLSSSIIAQSGKIFVGRYFGNGALARYSLVFSLGFLFTVVTGGISSGLSPWINRKLSHGAGHIIDITAEKLFSVFAILTLIATAFIPEGLSVLAPLEYRSYLSAVYPLSISVLLSFLSTTLYTVILYYEKGRLISTCSIFTAALTLFLHLTITKRFGYLAAAFVQIVASAITVLSYALILGGVLKKHTFKARKYVMTFLLCSTGSFLLSYFRNSILSRILFFSALILMLIPKAIECYRLIKEK